MSHPLLTAPLFNEPALLCLARLESALETAESQSRAPVTRRFEETQAALGPIDWAPSMGWAQASVASASGRDDYQVGFGLSQQAPPSAPDGAVWMSEMLGPGRSRFKSYCSCPYARQGQDGICKHAGALVRAMTLQIPSLMEAVALRESISPAASPSSAPRSSRL